MTRLVVPLQRLSEDALDGLLEEFVTRDGTDYGQREQTLAARVATLRGQLAGGRAAIVFDTELESYDILPVEALGKDLIGPPAA